MSHHVRRQSSAKSVLFLGVHIDNSLFEHVAWMGNTIDENPVHSL
jgi:hypothetical protein